MNFLNDIINEIFGISGATALISYLGIHFCDFVVIGVNALLNLLINYLNFMNTSKIIYEWNKIKVIIIIEKYVMFIYDLDLKNKEKLLWQICNFVCTALDTLGSCHIESTRRAGVRYHF